MKSLDGNDRVIYIGSLSKTLAPGLRLGYMVGPKELIDEARALRRLMLRHPPSNNQNAVAHFLALGHHDSLVHRLAHSYRQRWEAMDQALKEHLPESSRAPAFGGSAFWVKLPEGAEADVIERIAGENSILVVSGNNYFLDPRPENAYLRLGFSSIPSEKINDGIARLAKLIKESVS